MAKLTNALIENAKPREVRYEIRDDEIKGFFVVVHPATSIHPRGRRTFSIRTYLRELKKPCRTKLGEYGVITLDEARKRARAALALADQGVSPTLEMRGKGEQPAEVETIADAYQRYLVEYMEPDGSPTTVVRTRSCFRRWILPIVGHLLINKITRLEIEAMHAIIGKTAPGAADHALRDLSSLLSWCQGRGYRDSNLANPCKRGTRGIRTFGPQKTRDRILTRDEIMRLFQALNEHESEKFPKKERNHTEFASLIRLLFYTGARLSEVYRLEHKNALAMGHYLHWDQIDLDNGMIALSRTKEKKKKVLFLCKQAVDILRKHHEQKAAQGRLDCPVYECGYPGNIWILHVRPRAKLDKTIIQSAFTLHGFRHNFLTYAAEIGVPESIRKRLVGHAKGRDVTEGYTHISSARLRRYAQKIGDALDSLDIEAIEKDA